MKSQEKRGKNKKPRIFSLKKKSTNSTSIHRSKIHLTNEAVFYNNAFKNK
jgi:hypothetical protein